MHIDTFPRPSVTSLCTLQPSVGVSAERVSLLRAQRRCTGPNRHQLNRKLLTIRRGEGGGERRGGPLWSPASCSLCLPMEERAHTPGTGRPSRPSRPRIIHPRPYGIPGSRLRLMPITAMYRPPCPTDYPGYKRTIHDRPLRSLPDYFVTLHYRPLPAVPKS